MTRESIVFAPEVPDRELDREVGKIDDRLGQVDDSISPDLDINGGGELGMPDSDDDGSLGGIESELGGLGSSMKNRLPSSIPGRLAPAALPVAMAGGVGAGMLSAMQSSSARLQTSSSLLGQAWDNVWRPLGDDLDALFVRDAVEDVAEATRNFEETYREDTRLEAFTGLADDFAPEHGGLGARIRLFDTFARVRGIMDDYGVTVRDVGEILFDRLVGRWPGWPSIDTEWPGWPSIGPEWPGWPSIDTQWPGWPSVRGTWPGWPSIGPEWPGWPSIDTQWPGWPNIRGAWPGWPDIIGSLPDWSGLSPGVPDWSVLSPGIPDWRDLVPGIPDWSDLSPFGSGGGSGSSGSGSSGSSSGGTPPSTGGGGTGSGSGSDSGSGGGVAVPPPPIDDDGDLLPPGPGLQSGGVVRRDTVARVGEAGPEVVAPLSDFERFVERVGREVARQVAGSGGGGGGNDDLQRVIQRGFDELKREERKTRRALPSFEAVSDGQLARIVSRNQNRSVTDTDPLA